MEKGSKKHKNTETFILYNASDKDLTRADYISEMYHYKTKCFKCKAVKEMVQSLLDEISDLKEKEMLRRCVHCKRANPVGKCARCEYIMNKFCCVQVKQNEDRQNQFKQWLFKLNKLLNSILNENVCRHKLYRESTSALEVEKLLQELKSPLEMRQPEMVVFPKEPDPFSSLAQSKEMLEDLLITLKSETLNSFKRRSSDSLFVSHSRNDASSCVCKHFMGNKYEEKRSMEVLAKDKKIVENRSMEVLSESRSTNFVEPNLELKMKSRIDVSRESSDTGKNGKKLTSKKLKEKTDTKRLKERAVDKENISPNSRKQEKPGKTELKTPRLSPEEQMMLKMMKERQKDKKVKEKSVKADKVKPFAKIESLPELILKEVIEVFEEKSESVVECDHDYNVLPAEMIKSTRVVPFDPRFKDEHHESLPPLLYKIKAVCPEPVMPSNASATPISSTSDKENKIKSKYRIQDELLAKGVIKYALSDREFIEKGWTVLPTTKIMRRMNIYKMEAPRQKYGWFERNKDRKQLVYDTGEILAQIDCYGRGKWFYKNGMIALDYYNAQEINAGQRYVVYSSGEEVHNGKKTPITVLASFDYLGNGVVYDHYGQVRLKYNQSEGMVLDEKIGARGRWKWHSLNDPPILQPVFIDTHVEQRSSCIDKLLKNERAEGSTRHTRESNTEMTAIEFENFVKEKANKLLQQFKPFQIRMKVLKLNAHFSLRVLDQSNIYLLFRDGKISLKLNLGMVLISSEIVDTVTSEISDVTTPYDRYPPKSQSVAEIQRTLSNVRRIGRSHASKMLSLGKSISSKNSN